MRRSTGAVLALSAALVVSTALMLVSGCGKGSSTDTTLDEVLHLYQESWYKQAKKAAAEHMDEPLGKLVYHLCEVFDARARNLSKGLGGLRELYQDKELREKHPEIWCEAGLSYGRVIQVNQIRLREETQAKKLLPGEYIDVDVREVFSDIVARMPGSVYGAKAVVYLAESHFRSGEKSEHDAGFALIEKFLADYKGPAKNTVPVHLYIESYYINFRGDYAKSFKHLRTAYETGIAKDMLKRVVLFRLGRMSDIKLNNKKKEARAYYEEFRRQYEYAEQMPVVKRYLKELDGKGK